MPVMHGYMTKEGKRYGFYGWGESGKKYAYSLGDERSRKLARAKAARQGRAVQASKHKR